MPKDMLDALIERLETEGDQYDHDFEPAEPDDARRGPGNAVSAGPLPTHEESPPEQPGGDRPDARLYPFSRRRHSQAKRER